MRRYRLYAFFFTVIGLGFLAVICGCCRQRDEFTLDPYDYALAPRIIRQFFRDNPSGQVQVEAYCRPLAGEPGTFLDIDFDTGAVILRAVACDADECGDPRGWGACPSPLYLYLHGPHYTLYITLTDDGYAIGSEQAYRFRSPTLSRALERACKAKGVLTARLRHLFKRGAGEDVPANPELFAPP